MKNVLYVEKDKEIKGKNVFEDREAGGKALLDIIEKEIVKDSIIVGIPNGGIKVARVLADHFKLPLKMVISKKIPMKGLPFVGLGAVTENKVVYNKQIIKELALSDEILEGCVSKAKSIVFEKKKLIKQYILKLDNLENKKVILVDDGVSSGYTILGAIKEVSIGNPLQIVVATPVIHKKSRDDISKMGINVYYKYIGDNRRFVVDDYYLNFDDIDDDEILGYKIRK